MFHGKLPDSRSTCHPSLRKASKEGTGGSFRGIIDDSWILSRLYFSREATGQPLDVSPHVSVAEACRNFGRFVTFQFVEPGSKEVEGEASEPKNAFAELMRSAAAQTRSLVLPMPRNECRGDWRLFNALIHSLKSDGLGFSTASGLAETSGKEFVDALATVLFHLLIPERIERMEARGIKLPARWTKLTDGGVTFNDPKAHKHGVGALTEENVIQWRNMLYRVLLFPWLSKQQWHGISQATRDLASCLQKYATYLESATQRVNAMHNMLEPARCPGDGSSSELKRIESSARPDKLIRRYKAVEEALSSQAVYGDHSSWLTMPLLIDGSDTSCKRLWLKGRVGVSVCVQS